MRFNAIGDLTGGVAGGVLSINRTKVGDGGGPMWRDRDRMIANAAVGGVWGLYEFRRANAWAPTLIDPRGASTIAAGDGNYIATLNSQPEYQTYGEPALVDPLLHSHALDGCDGGPFVAAAPDYLTLYARWPDGQLETIPIEAHWNPSSVRAVPGGIVDMVEGIGLQWRARGAAPRVIQTIDAAFDPSSFLDRNGVRWFLYHNEGTYLHRDGADVGYNLPASYGPDAFYFADSHMVRLALTPSAGELPETIRLVDLHLGVDEVPLEKPVTVIKIGRRLWFGFFTFAGRSTLVPTNCDLSVGPNGDGFIRANDATPIGRYVAVNADENNLDALEQLIAASQAKYPALASVPYWTRQAQLVRFPKGAKHVGAEWYCGVDESDAAYEARIRRSCRIADDNHARVWGLAQCYTSNDRLTKNLRRIVPIVARVAATEPNVDAVIPFSGTGRGTGLQDHPEVVDLWIAFSAGILGAPPIIVTPPPVPLPPPIPPPAPPPPTPIPVPSPIPPAPAPVPEEPQMQLPARCFVLLHNSNIAAVTPGSTVVELNHSPQEYGGYQEVEITKSKEWTPTNPRVLVRFTGANRELRVDKVLAGQRKYDECLQTWPVDAPDADSSWEQALAYGPMLHWTGDSADGTRHGVVYTATCVDKDGKLFQ